MTAEVEVIIPWMDTGCEHRAKALRWVLDWWEAVLDWWDPAKVTLAEVEGGSSWVKAAAVMPAVAASSADIVIVADADVACDGIAAALGAVEAGDHPWAIPHQLVYRLNRKATLAVLDDGADPRRYHPGFGLSEEPYLGAAGGGLLVARREVFLDVPFDPRFVGWGGEDYAIGYALRCLWGEPWRGTHPILHLWHPPQERLNRRVGSHANDALRAEYRRQRHTPERMRAIVNDAKEALGWAGSNSSST